MDVAHEGENERVEHRRAPTRSGDRQMRKHIVLCITALVGLLAMAPAGAVQPCPDSSSCAQVSISNLTGAPGAVVSIPFTFTQGPLGSGIGQVAAIAFTLTMPGGVVPPLTLADCTPSAADSDLPNAVDPSGLAGYKLVIENAYCSPPTRTHCLCPTDSTVPDNFINVVIYGPNPLPTPGPSPVVIPPLPGGQLFTMSLKVGSTVGGNVPLHVLNQVTDSPSTRPAFTALLSVGDVNAVDQTCSYATPPAACPPPTGQCPLPCNPNDPTTTSQVSITDGRVLVTNGCVGNCDYSSGVTVDEILTMVNIDLGNTPIGACEAGDATGDGRITVDEILSAVNYALNGCPA
jgi:hypothetical protein